MNTREFKEVRRCGRILTVTVVTSAEGEKQYRFA